MAPPIDDLPLKALRFAITGALLLGASGCGQEQHIRTNEPAGPVEPPEWTTMNEPEPEETVDDLGPDQAPPPPEESPSTIIEDEETVNEPAPE